MRLLGSWRLAEWVVSQLYKVAQYRKKDGPIPKDKIKRVVHVSPTYFHDNSIIGGGERYPTELAQAMNRLVPTTLVSFGPRRQSLHYHELPLEIYPAHRWVREVRSDPLNYTFFKELVTADVVHCHQYRTVATNLAILAGAALGKLVCVSDMGGVGVHFTDKYPLADLVNVFLPISAYSTRFLPQTRRQQVIFGGVNPRFLEVEPDTSGKDYVLFVGRLMPHKGINYLIDAVDSNTKLKVIGRPYNETYFQYLQERAAGKPVEFNTEVGDDQLATLYRQALVTVLPSVYKDVYGNEHIMPELLGLVLLESMACGTPVICTEVGSMPEIVNDGVTGFVVPPNDPAALRERITYLWQNPEKARQMGQAARQKVLADFTWEAVARHCLIAYTSRQE